MFLFISGTNGQMRQVHPGDLTGNYNQILKISFYSPSQGYVASTEYGGPWVGFTADSGRTLSKRFITISNVNYNGYSVALPFIIKGVKAFSQDTILVYGGYNITPSILYSTDGGLTYLLVYHSQFGPTQIGHVYDMSFPQNNNIGYAVDGYRILKTTNKGQSWVTSFFDVNGPFGGLDGIDNNNVFAFSDYLNAPGGKLFKTSNGGANWQQVSIPGSLYAADFITTTKGLVNINYGGDSSLIYYTADGGNSWVKKNDGVASSFQALKMQFVNDSTAYGIYDLYTTYKTRDTGRVWEPLARDNNFNYLGYGHNDIQAISQTQVWSGGGKDFLELTTNGGGTPLPRAFCKTDTVGVYNTQIVRLQNYSRRNYTYKWYVNNTLVSTAYNASYIHNITSYDDSIKLVVNNGILSDSVTVHQYFTSPVTITGFSPVSGITGTSVTITGTNFTGATSVSFGGVPAASFTVNSSSSITAIVGSGASGSVKVVTPLGIGSRPGFTYTPPPVITSFNPTSGGRGTTIFISGSNFTGTTSVKFGILFATSFTVINSNTISASNTNGGTGSITVTTPGGTATISGYTFIPEPGITSVNPNTGGTGSVISITGGNFQNAVSVKFGGVDAASFTLNSATSITAVVGTGASGTVTITTPVGGTGFGPSFTFTTQPVIHYFSPLSGPVGSSISIIGANFPSNPAAIMVYFGPVKGTVTSVNANTLNVLVPPGASSGFIKIIINGLLYELPKEFMVTFPGDLVFNNSSFAGRIDFASGNYTNDMAVADFDGDGRPDFVSVNTLDNTISIFRNTSTPGVLSFAAKIDLSSGSLSPNKIAVGDIDLDGRLDIAVAVNDLAPGASTQSMVVLYRNTSTPGIISFAQRIEVSTGFFNRGLTDILVTDHNKDGKPDILVLNSSSADDNFTYLRNTTNGSAISFVIQTNISLAYNNNRYLPSSMAAGDVDNDGKEDVVIGYQSGNNTLAFIPGYSTNPQINVWANSPDVALSDFDGDGDLDLITRNNVYSNNTSLLTLNFTGFSLPGMGQSGSMSCLNGDAKPDFAACDFANSTVKVARNTSTPGLATMAIDATYPSGQSPVAVATADFDMDQRPDILVANRASNNVSILKNQVQYTGPVIYSFTPTSGINGTNVTITGSNLAGATAVSFGGVAASSFIVVNSTTITAVVGTGTSGVISVVTPSGTASLGGFTFGSVPVISSFVPASGITGTVVTIFGANFTGATAVKFGGTNASSFSVVNSTTITAVVAAGSSGAVSVTAPGGTISATGFTYIAPPVINSFTPVVGVQNTQVTISGLNFIGVTGVSFGGVAASFFTVSNSSAITATVSTGATGNVIVTTLAGTASLAGFTFASTPTITSFSPTTATTGTTVTITGTNFTGVTTVSFGGTAASSFNVVNSTTITAVVGSGATGSVAVTNPAGTASKSGFTYTVVTAVGDPNRNNSKELLVSPNPTGDMVLIKHPASIKNSYLKLIDMDGRTVKLVAVGRNVIQTTMSVKGIASGMYKLIWTDEKRTYKRTLMITQ